MLLRLLTGFVVSAQALALSQGILRAMLWIRLRFLAVVALAVGIVSGGATVYVRGPREPAPKDDLAVSKQSAIAQVPQRNAVQEVPADDVPLRLTLDEALKAALAIGDPGARRLALVRIAKAQASLNDLTSARATARLAQQSAEKISSEMERHFRLGLVAKLQANLGDLEPARQTFERLIRETDAKAPGDRISLLGSIAITQAEGGLRADADKTMNRATEAAKALFAKTANGDIYHNVILAQCQFGDFDGALRIAESIQSDKDMYSDIYLQHIARDCDKAGPAEARRILTKALALSKRINRIYPRGGTQKQIAQAMARNGDIPGALAASKLIGQVEEVPEPRGILSFFNARETRIRRELDKRMGAELQKEVADVLITIAAQQARSGDRPAARTSFGEAMEMIQRERDESWKTQRLQGMVETLAGVGELEAARIAIEAIQGDEDHKARALVALAKAQSKAGNKVGARESLMTALGPTKEIKARPNTINDDPARRKDETLRVIATTQAELGEIQDAMATVSVHGDQRLKAEIHTQAAELQARQGDIAGALKTVESIADAGSKAEALKKIAHAQSRTGQQDLAHDWAAKLSSPQERAMALLGVVEGAFARRRGE